ARTAPKRDGSAARLPRALLTLCFLPSILIGGADWTSLGCALPAALGWTSWRSVVSWPADFPRGFAPDDAE
ncbi:hypothetical protein LCGC14_2396810, partial [marine sediment metagenome]